MKKAGITIIILGIVLTVFTAFTFFTKEKVADLGTVEITRSKPHNLKWSPLLGLGVVVAGIVLFFVPGKKS
jgi:hypothetical protein